MVKVRSHLTYGNVVATLALFLALGGGAYAAAKLPKNSVGAKQIKRSAVGSSEVKNGSLKAGDFDEDSLPRGPKGDAGAKGPAGPAGPPGTAGAAQTCPQGMTKLSNALCLDATDRTTGNWSAAVVACANAGLRLPSASELQLALAKKALPGGGLDYWSSDVFRETTGQPFVDRAVVLRVDGDQFLIQDSGAANAAARCATAPGA
ncbi:MAG TPA: hypothetical protein VF533_24760 [Solirubrobacteraceae bacterium]|jgi:hypothetical protein